MVQDRASGARTHCAGRRLAKAAENFATKITPSKEGHLHWVDGYRDIEIWRYREIEI
jgi:hypothetical protein